MIAAVMLLSYETGASLRSWLRSCPSPRDWPRTPTGHPAMVTDIAWNGMMDAVAQVAVETFLALSGLSPPRYGINLRNVWLSALLPGQTIEPHQDEQPPEWRERFHVPIVTNADAYFIQDGAAHVMTVGRVWRVDPRRRHAVWNAGQTPRVHLMFDRYGT